MNKLTWLSIEMERKTTKAQSDTEMQAEATDKPRAEGGAFIPKHVTKEAWRKMSLMDKWKASYRQDYTDHTTTNISSRFSCGVMWYTALSMEYVVTAFMVDELLSEYSPMSRYYMRVFCTFVFIQVIANWLCTVCYQSDLRETKDNPDIDKLLWDEHPGRNGKKEVSIEDSNSDRTGLVWKWCDLCKMEQPPRTHHCKICQKCILKRDHHCFFTGRCIGFYNQRYFIFLVFYLSVASIGYFPCFHHYMQLYFAPNHTWAQYFLPVTMYDCVFGDIEFKYVLLMSHYYLVWWGGAMSVAFFCTQMCAIAKGLTINEMYKKSNIRCTATVQRNFRDVFGTCWLFNFIFPTVILFRQEGDGKHWTGIKKV